jgi:hypothetical protein
VRIIKLILVSLLILSTVVCFISFFLPSRIRISRTIRIDANSETVMNELRDPERWKDWYPGADSAEFFYQSGMIKGLVLKKKPFLSLVVNEIKESEVLTTYNKAASRKSILSTWRVFPETSFNHVTVQWYLDFHIQWYPWEKFSSLVYDRFYGSLMDQGLENLKKKAELK